MGNWWRTRCFELRGEVHKLRAQLEIANDSLIAAGKQPIRAAAEELPVPTGSEMPVPTPRRDTTNGVW